ncbi:hypothetical protein J7K07_01735 [Candidatus Bathyarchaeota archaeon]|nr:hypothetical protein [Candidatus Bathyarchaeota archaeon]
MIDKILRRRRKSLNEAVLDATRELGKCYSRIELAVSKLEKRSRDLFNTCTACVKKGSRARATIYANELAEIRRVLSILKYVQLAVERAIIRLDTIRIVSSNLEALRETFGEVRNALNLVADVIPSMIPEISRLNAVVNEILEETEFNLSMPMLTQPAGPSAEAILREAASTVEKELEAKIPEPPIEKPTLRRVDKPAIALSVTNYGVHSTEESSSKKTFDVSSFLAEELVLDYIERNNGNMNVTRCARELNMPYDKVLQILESLKKKGKIEIQQ